MEVMFGECLYPHPFFNGALKRAVYVSVTPRRISVAFLNEGGVSGPGLVVDKKTFLEKRSS
jgi:hypothetical protein